MITDPYDRAAAERGAELPPGSPEDEAPPEHDIQWLKQASLRFQTGCDCGWTGHSHLMERDAKREYRQHAGLPEPPAAPYPPGQPDRPDDYGPGHDTRPEEIAADQARDAAAGRLGADRHLQTMHGPILTRADLEQARAEHDAECGPGADARIWLASEAADLVTRAIQRYGLTPETIRASVNATLALHEPPLPAPPPRQPILRLPAAGVPEQCGSCGGLVPEAPLRANRDGAIYAECPGCHAVIAPVRLTAGPGLPLPALGVRVARQDPSCVQDT